MEVRDTGKSVDLQDVALWALIHDTDALSNYMPYLDELLFQSESHRLILRGLIKYFKKYLIVPSFKDFKLEIYEIIPDNDEHKDILENTLLEAKRLYDDNDYNVESACDKLGMFIRRGRAERTLMRFASDVNNGKAVDMLSVTEQIAEDGMISVSNNEAYSLADIQSIPKINAEAFGGSQHPIVVKFFIDVVNSFLSNGGFVPGTLNVISAPPGRGKTTMLINQGIYVAEQGYNVLHMFLGDMSPRTALIRYLASFTGKQSNALNKLNTEELQQFVVNHNTTGILSHVFIAAYPPDELTALQVFQEVKKIQKSKGVHFDVIIIDYDENIRDENPSMYESGGDIYNKMRQMADKNKSVVFIASQPKPQYWKESVMPLDSLSESSKKQKIVDFVAFLNKNNKVSSAATFCIAKNRDGADHKVMRLSIDGATAKIKHITEEEFENIERIEKSQIN